MTETTITGSLERRLAQLVNHLESTRGSGGLKHCLDYNGIDFILDDPEVSQWLDKMNRDRVVTKGSYLGC